MKLLLISNSTMAGEAYLDWTRPHISEFLNRHKVKKICFIPYAGVRMSSESLISSYDIYAQRVAGVFQTMGITVQSIHKSDNPVETIREAKAVVVGGGNTFHLVAEMQKKNIMGILGEKILGGTPFIGWSAGANIASPTLMTTNDMPIIEPASFKTLGLIPFQINPHYIDTNPAGHGGETRQQRILEFIMVNPEMTVAGLREGCLLQLENNELRLIGNKSLRVFRNGQQPKEFVPESNLSFLL